MFVESPSGYLCMMAGQRTTSETKLLLMILIQATQNAQPDFTFSARESRPRLTRNEHGKTGFFRPERGRRRPRLDADRRDRDPGRTRPARRAGFYRAGAADALRRDPGALPGRAAGGRHHGGRPRRLEPGLRAPRLRRGAAGDHAYERERARVREDRPSSAPARWTTAERPSPR